MNEYYTPSGTPAFLTRALSSQQRSEDGLVQAGFDKLPSPSNLAGSAQNYAVDTGTTNAIVIALNPNITTPYDGMELVVRAISPPTGPTTILAGALALANVVRQDGSPIQTNDWLANQIISLRWNAAHNAYDFLIQGASGAPVALPLSDGAAQIANAADPSKLIRFDASRISHGATRTVIVPDYDNIMIGKAIFRSARTSNTILGFNDLGTLIEFTSGSFVQTFSQGSVLTNGWWARLHNSGTGDIEVEAPAYVSTTSTSATSGFIGSVSLTVGTGLAISATDLVIVRQVANPNNRFSGTVTSYNSGTGAIVINNTMVSNGTGVSGSNWTVTTRPASAAIDGKPSYTMYPGECRDFYCDGTALYSKLVQGFSKTFSVQGGFIKPPGYTDFHAEIGSAAASGGRSGGAAGAFGGPGGGVFPCIIPASKFGNSTGISVGSGGTAVTGASITGNPGGQSNIGSLVFVSGATGTVGGAITAAQGIATLVGGFESLASTAASVSVIYGGVSPSNNFSVDGGSSFKGGGCGGSVNGAGALRAPGTSSLNGNGGAALDTSSGVDGTYPCGGGGATRTGVASGVGADGYVMIMGKA